MLRFRNCNYTHLSWYASLCVSILTYTLVLANDNLECIKNIKHSSQGVITSPGYPYLSYRNATCTWYITGKPNEIITIQFGDVNLDDSTYNCQHSWIELGPASDKKSKRYCGPHSIPPSFVSSKYRVWITYHIANDVINADTGFRLTYSIEPKRSEQCKPHQFHCKSGKCIPSSWTCNGRFECENGSDEVDCKHVCSGNKLHCGDGEHCYDVMTQKCNGVWDCPNGADELGCSECKSDEFMCKSRSGCYSRRERCNNITDCLDMSDEMGCGWCKWNQVLCSFSGRGCFNPNSERCNGRFECQKGEDEVNCNARCPNKLYCKSGKGCYLPQQRCNSIANCADSSDEKNCSSEVCKRDIGGFLCKNKMCIRESWICDQTNDCGDYSDEEGCVKNSVITAAVMGALICGLLLVIAVGCTCKLYTLRIVEQHDLNYETPMSQIEREFLQREPPPPYSIAVGGMPFYNQDQFPNHYCLSFPVRPGRSRNGRRTRRHHSRRRRAPSPPPICHVISPPLAVNQSNAGTNSPATSTTSIHLSDNEFFEVSPTTVNNNNGSNSSSSEPNCDPNKSSKPVTSALLVVNSEDHPTAVDKSDSSSECSVQSLCNSVTNNQIQLETLSRQSVSMEDVVNDDMLPLCAS